MTTEQPDTAATVTPLATREHGCVMGCTRRARWEVQPGPRRNVWRVCGTHLSHGVERAIRSRPEEDAWTST
jgi:hypothetical protein